MGTKKTAPAPKKSAEVATGENKEPVTSVVEDKAPDTPIIDAPSTQEGGGGGDTGNLVLDTAADYAELHSVIAPKEPVTSVVEDKAPDTAIVDAPSTQEGGGGGDKLDIQDGAIDLESKPSSVESVVEDKAPDTPIIDAPSTQESGGGDKLDVVESEVKSLYLESEKDLLGIDFPATFTISNTKPTRLVIDKTRHYVEPYSVKDVGVDNANVAKNILECVKRNNKVLATPITVSLK